MRMEEENSREAAEKLQQIGSSILGAARDELYLGMRFLDLLYTRGRGLSIRRMHNKLDIIFQETTKKLYCSYKRTTETASLRSLDGPQGLLWETSAQELPNFAPGD